MNRADPRPTSICKPVRFPAFVGSFGGAWANAIVALIAASNTSAGMESFTALFDVTPGTKVALASCGEFHRLRVGFDGVLPSVKEASEINERCQRANINAAPETRTIANAVQDRMFRNRCLWMTVGVHRRERFGGFKYIHVRFNRSASVRILFQRPQTTMPSPAKWEYCMTVPGRRLLHAGFDNESHTSHYT